VRLGGERSRRGCHARIRPAVLPQDCPVLGRLEVEEVHEFFGEESAQVYGGEFFQRRKVDDPRPVRDPHHLPDYHDPVWQQRTKATIIACGKLINSK
jgi:hypothetical protein